MTIWNFIKNQMMRHCGQKICEESAEMTYEDMVIFAEKFAEKLKGEKCCAIMCGSEMAASMGLLSCLAAGVTALPLSVRYGDAHCKKILSFIKPTCMITDLNGEFCIHKFDFGKYIEPREHPALIMCTSGTTGSPKGVMLSDENVICNIKDISDYFEIGNRDSILITRPLYHCAVLTGEFLFSLYKGVKIRFYSRPFNPIEIMKLIKKHNITVFGGTPTTLTLISKLLGKVEKLELEKIVVSGECLSRESGERIREAFPSSKIYHVYGLSEASPRVAWLPTDAFDKYPDYVGIPLASVEVKILKGKKKCGINEAGVLYVKGNNVMMGYYNDAELSKKVFSGGWLYTGDVALVNEAGFLKILGRKDNMIIKAGMNIYPQEIEAAIKTDERVKEVLVYGKSNELGITDIAMKISGDFEGIDEVKELCLRELPRYQVPAHIELVDEIEKNANGKIVRGRKNA